MRSTLSERLKLAMAGPPKVTGAAIARACGISPPSVSDWLSGKSKTMEGKNLLATARLLRVRPDWLANGLGLMREEPLVTLATKEPEPPTLTTPVSGRTRAAYLLQGLPETAIPEALAHLEYLTERHKSTGGAVDHHVPEAKLYAA